jgi:DNA-binding transcriptional regulator YhcF (GntR family)
MKKLPAPNEAAAIEPRLYRVVSGKIEELIRAENIQPGERLPSERDLATKLGVSRTSLREALIALELGGTVEVRGGSGVYVSEQATPVVEVPTAGPGPFEVLAARRLIEVEVAALAAKHASDSAIDAILVAVLEMEQHHEERSGNEQADRKPCSTTAPSSRPSLRTMSPAPAARCAPTSTASRAPSRAAEPAIPDCVARSLSRHARSNTPLRPLKTAPINKDSRIIYFGGNNKTVQHLPGERAAFSQVAFYQSA